MSWTLKIKSTRPNTDTEFYREGASYLSDSALETQKSAYEDSGKLISCTVETSSNELELLKTWVFKDKETMKEWFDDTKITDYVSARDTYNTNNSITREKVQNEET